MTMIKWEDCREDLGADGALRDIQVVGAGATDWQRVLDFIRASAGQLRYTIDGAAAELPLEASAVLALRAKASPSLLFRWGDIDIATHFFGEDDLEFDFRPDDIHGQAQLDQLASFISGIGHLLQKTILVYHEGWEMSPIFTYDVHAADITYVPQGI